MADFLACKRLYPVIVQLYDLLLYLLRIKFLHLAHNMTSGKFTDEQGGPLGCPLAYERVCPPFITERSICAETVSF